LAHCDLHPTNLLWDGSSFAIIDLDTAALAPAAADYGTLVASIAHRALVAGASAPRVADMIQKFRCAAAAELGDLDHFDWFVAASLLGERLYRCGTRLKSPQFRVRKALVDLAEGCLDNLENGHGR
jgi:Ser/Thr protein kinase RdoA (MazF antagonist)